MGFNLKIEVGVSGFSIFMIFTHNTNMDNICVNIT